MNNLRDLECVFIKVNNIGLNNTLSFIFVKLIINRIPLIWNYSFVLIQEFLLSCDVNSATFHYIVKWSLIWMFRLTWTYKSYIKFIRDHSFNTTAPFMYTLQYSNFLYNMLFLVVPNSLSRWRLMFLLTITFLFLICIWKKSWLCML